ncbi:MAG: sugar phosphate isomerase/epimerase family protein, partial [Nitrososphaerales archaeon]
IQLADGLLKHVHFADNNRKMPGFAHIDFGVIMKSLQKIGYDQYISLEPNVFNKNYERDLRKSLRFLSTVL